MKSLLPDNRKREGGGRAPSFAKRAKRFLFSFVVDGEDPTVGRVAYLFMMFLLNLVVCGALVAFLGVPAIIETIASPDLDIVKVLQVTGFTLILVLLIAFFGAKFWLSYRALTEKRPLHPDYIDEKIRSDSKKCGLNAICISCKHFIQIDPEQESPTCPLCGERLDGQQAQEFYRILKREEEEEVQAYAKSLSGWKYYSKKFLYFWRGSLPFHAICVPLIAVSLLTYHFARRIADFPLFNVVAGLAVLAELIWLFWLIMPVSMAGVHEDIARDELLRVPYDIRFKKVRIALVVVGLAVIVGCLAYGAATAPPPKKASKASLEQILERRQEEIPPPRPTPSLPTPPLPTKPPEPPSDTQTPDSASDSSD